MDETKRKEGLQLTIDNGREVQHFTHLPHVWWGAKTVAGKARYHRKALLFKKTCSVRNDSKILEVGCGDGMFTKELIKVLPITCSINATDITPKLIKDAKKRIKRKNVLFKIDNLEAMGFPANMFDIVCGISILHHVNTQKALGEIYRILRKGGEIFFTEPNMLNPQMYISHHIQALRKLHEYSPDETAFMRWRLQTMLRNAGFRQIQVKNYDFLHPLTPSFLITSVEKIEAFAERIPFIKEVSGSLMIHARK